MWTLPVLTTPRLVIRALQLSDAPAVYDYCKNPNVALYTLWEPHVSVSDSEAFIRDDVFAHYQGGTLEPLAITLRARPDWVIGTVGCFWSSRENKTLELAYALGEPHWGQGLSTEAALAVLEHSFATTDANKITARCKLENVGSRRVMEKLGLLPEGHFREALWHRERYWDLLHYAILRADWDRRANLNP